ncbi:MAG: heme-binding protein [Chromatiaceae bacterium]
MFKMLGRLAVSVGVTIGISCPALALADDLVNVKQMSVDLAEELVRAAVTACRAQGWQVTAVAVDRTAVPQAMLRDTLASRFTIQIAVEKANAVVLSGVASSEFRHNRGDIRPEMDQVDGILVLDGAVPVRAAGSLVGAIGVSGAPGGDKDEMCALAAIKSVQDRLDFEEGD